MKTIKLFLAIFAMTFLFIACQEEATQADMLGYWKSDEISLWISETEKGLDIKSMSSDEKLNGDFSGYVTDSDIQVGEPLKLITYDKSKDVMYLLGFELERVKK